MRNKNIPSESDFARASLALKNRSRGLSEVRERMLNYFKESGAIHEFFILDCSENSFRAYVFYPRDGQIKQAELSGLASEIRNAVFANLEAVGRGGCHELHVEFEFDSHENVERKYEGNYYNRLH